MESSDKIAAIFISAVFNTREHVDSMKVLWNRSFRVFK